MPNARADAVRASRPKAGDMPCSYCSAQNSVSEVTYLCGECGLPQPLQPHETYFSVFSLPVKLHLTDSEISALQARFYEASRALHPDRFTRTTNALAQQASVERMSFLNQAWMTLRSPTERRQYVLKQEGLASLNPGSVKVQPVMEFAEDWFELQDLFLEDPAQAKGKALELRNRIQTQQKDLEEKIQLNEHEWDSSHERAKLESILKLSLQLNTLRSLERDLLQKGMAS